MPLDTASRPAFGFDINGLPGYRAERDRHGAWYFVAPDGHKEYPPNPIDYCTAKLAVRHAHMWAKRVAEGK